MRWLPGRGGRRRLADLDDDAFFERMVREAAARLSMGVLRFDPAGEVEVSSMTIAGTVDLRNVRQICASLERDRWYGVIVEHLAGLASIRAAPRGYADLERVRPLLRSRLYDESEFLLADVLARPLAPGVVEALVVVEDGAIGTIPRPDARHWAEDLDNLYALARRQVREEGRPAVRDVDLDGVTLTAVESPSFFTTTHLFWLPDLVDLPADGALVALPTRYLMLVHPVRDASVVDAVQAMIVNTQALHEQGPGSLSPHLYWWRDGGLTLLPATVEPERISFRPPPEFGALVERLTR